MSARKAQTSAATAAPVKYCSDRCRHRKPGALDRRIEATFLALLDGRAPPDASEDHITAAAEAIRRQKRAKGETRVVVNCGVVEEAVFGPRSDPEKVFGRKKNRKSRVLGKEGEWKSVDMEDSTADEEDEDEDRGEDVDWSVDEDEGGVELVKVDDDMVPIKDTVAARIRPAQLDSDVNGSIGGEKGWAERQQETADALEKRRDGQKRADEREMVRRAARRLVAFGIVTSEAPPEEHERRPAKGKKGKAERRREEEDEDKPKEYTRKCEAIMKGQLVEASFAKGEWGVRWREQVASA